jgi:ferric-dicitrate binding protein FerR (iron transport regulator)
MAIDQYIDRLFEDEYVREQIGDALVRGRSAVRRARAQRASKAIQDQRLFDQLSGAVRSLQEAARALAGRPQPKPRRRGLRTTALLATALAAGGVAAYLDSRWRAGPE